MTRGIKAMTDSHLAVEDAMGNLVEAFREARQGKAELDAVRQRTKTLEKRFLYHLTVGQSLGQKAENMTGVRPREVDALDTGARDLLAQIRAFREALAEKNGAEELSTLCWQELRALLQGLLDSFEVCGQQEWAFSTRWSSLLFPSGVSAD